MVLLGAGSEFLIPDVPSLTHFQQRVGGLGATPPYLPPAGFCFCSPTTSSVLELAWRFDRLELVEVQECMQRHDRVIKDVDSEAFTVEVCRCMQRSPELRLCYPTMCKFLRARCCPVLPRMPRSPTVVYPDAT